MQFCDCCRNIGHFLRSVERIKHLVNVHLHYIVRNLKKDKQNVDFLPAGKNLRTFMQSTSSDFFLSMLPLKIICQWYLHFYINFSWLLTFLCSTRNFLVWLKRTCKKAPRRKIYHTTIQVQLAVILSTENCIFCLQLFLAKIVILVIIRLNLSEF